VVLTSQISKTINIRKCSIDEVLKGEENAI